MEDYEVELTSSKTSKPKNEGQLTVDVYQTEDEIVIQSPIAASKSGDIEISVAQDMITIRGNRSPEENIRSSQYFHQELFWGPFSRSIILPVDIDIEGAKASARNGLLTIRLPKLEKVKTKKIKISL